jgi:hypothetical protein
MPFITFIHLFYCPHTFLSGEIVTREREIELRELHGIDEDVAHPQIEVRHDIYCSRCTGAAEPKVNEAAIEQRQIERDRLRAEACLVGGIDVKTAKKVAKKHLDAVVRENQERISVRTEIAPWLGLKDGDKKKAKKDKKFRIEAGGTEHIMKDFWGNDKYKALKKKKSIRLMKELPATPPLVPSESVSPKPYFFEKDLPASPLEFDQSFGVLATSSSDPLLSRANKNSHSQMGVPRIPQEAHLNNSQLDLTKAFVMGNDNRSSLFNGTNTLSNPRAQTIRKSVLMGKDESSTLFRMQSVADFQTRGFMRAISEEQTIRIMPSMPHIYRGLIIPKRRANAIRKSLLLGNDEDSTLFKDI